VQLDFPTGRFPFLKPKAYVQPGSAGSEHIELLDIRPPPFIRDSTARSILRLAMTAC
jgi:hypothetical protein